jgi:hypothetical protein
MMGLEGDQILGQVGSRGHDRSLGINHCTKLASALDKRGLREI